MWVTCVCQVVDNLHISHIEIRTEDDPEVAPYRHERQIESVTCCYGKFHGVTALKGLVNDLMVEPLARLHSHGLIACDQPKLLNTVLVNEANRYCGW